MEVFYGLTRVFAGVGNNTEAVGEIERNGELCRDLKYVRHNGAVALINIERGGDVLLGNYENMQWIPGWCSFPAARRDRSRFLPSIPPMPERTPFTFP